MVKTNNFLRESHVQVYFLELEVILGIRSGSVKLTFSSQSIGRSFIQLCGTPCRKHELVFDESLFFEKVAVAMNFHSSAVEPMQVDAPPDDVVEVQDEPDQPYSVENNAFVRN